MPSCSRWSSVRRAVAQRGEVEPQDQQDHVGLAEHDRLLLAERVVEVDHHVGERGQRLGQGLLRPPRG